MEFMTEEDIENFNRQHSEHVLNAKKNRVKSKEEIEENNRNKMRKELELLYSQANEIRRMSKPSEHHSIITGHEMAVYISFVCAYEELLDLDIHISHTCSVYADALGVLSKMNEHRKTVYDSIKKRQAIDKRAYSIEYISILISEMVKYPKTRSLEKCSRSHAKYIQDVKQLLFATEMLELKYHLRRGCVLESWGRTREKTVQKSITRMERALERANKAIVRDSERAAVLESEKTAREVKRAAARMTDCSFCGRIFDKIKKGRRKFCSQKCTNDAAKKRKSDAMIRREKAQSVIIPDEIKVSFKIEKNENCEKKTAKEVTICLLDEYGDLE